MSWQHEPDRAWPGPAQLAVWVAVGASVLWLALIGLIVLFMPPLAAPVPLITRVFQGLAVLLPLGLVWGGVWALRMLVDLRAEAAELRATLGALRQPAPPPARDAPAARSASGLQRPIWGHSPAAAPAPVIGMVQEAPDGPDDLPGQGMLDLVADPAVGEPLPMASLIAALNFPQDAADEDGFRALARALADPAVARVIRAAEDVLTLLSEDGVYAEDLTVAEAAPGLWQRFALGERGGPVAALAGIADEDLLDRIAERLRHDPVFRDAGHHFLRQFDGLLEGLLPRCDDEVIRLLTDTRSARAFILLGQASGSFGTPG